MVDLSSELKYALFLITLLVFLFVCSFIYMEGLSNVSTQR